MFFFMLHSGLPYTAPEWHNLVCLVGPIPNKSLGFCSFPPETNKWWNSKITKRSWKSSLRFFFFFWKEEEREKGRVGCNRLFDCISCTYFIYSIFLYFFFYFWSFWVKELAGLRWVLESNSPRNLCVPVWGRPANSLRMLSDLLNNQARVSISLI